MKKLPLLFTVLITTACSGQNPTDQYNQQENILIPGKLIIPEDPIYSEEPTTFHQQFSLNGKSDYISIPDSSSTSQTTTWTFAGFFTPQTVLPRSILASKWDYGSNGNWALGTGFGGDPSKLVIFASDISGSGTDTNRSAQTPTSIITVGVRKHIAIVYNGKGTANINNLYSTTDKIKIFVNGVPQPLLIGGVWTSSMANISAPLEIGRWKNSNYLSTSNWNGEVDYLKYYSINLSDNNIKSLANGDVISTGLVSDWTDRGVSPGESNVADNLHNNNATLVGGTRIVYPWSGVNTNSSALKIMFAGDSTTRGSGWVQLNEPIHEGGGRVELYNHLTARGKKFDFVGSQIAGPSYLNDKDHEGYPGIQCPELQVKILTAINIYQPNIIRVACGINDIYYKQTGSQTLISMEKLLRASFAAKPNLIIFVSTVLNNTSVILEAEVRNFNNNLPVLINKLQQEGKNITMVDITQRINFDDMFDTWHPSRQGYSKEAEMYLPYFLKRL